MVKIAYDVSLALFLKGQEEEKSLIRRLIDADDT